jgi:hypothetical protein
MLDKLKDIKNIASDAVEIIRELGTPEVQESLEKIRDRWDHKGSDGFAQGARNGDKT